MERVRATVLFVSAAGMAPAIAQARIFIRGESYLYAIGAGAGS